MRLIGTIAVGLALGAGAAPAQAQTSVTRQITSEPVETIVTRGPYGAAVTRRILTPEPGVTSYGTTYGAPLGYPPVAAEVLEPQYVEPAAPGLVTRRVTTRRAVASPPTTVGLSARTPERTRIEPTRRISERPARLVNRTVTPPSDYALVLSPAQRQVIYRTVVQREYYPAPVPARPLVAQTDIFVPPAPSRYPLRIHPADDGYRDAGYRDYAYAGYADRDYADRDYAYRRDPYRDYAYRDDDYRYPTAYRWNGVPLVVGARIPASVPLVAVPEPVAARIPVAGPYSYAVLDNRVYLVDPATGIIVAAIAQ
jgi:hypothetical protein